MAKKSKQGKIQIGYPKLAFWAGPPTIVSFPSTARAAWNYKRRELMPNELVVVVAQRETTSYHDRIANQYEMIQNWRTNTQRIIFNHIIPVEAIGKGEIPITCIYNWTQSYKELPHFLTKYLRFIESTNGEKSFTVAA